MSSKQERVEHWSRLLADQRSSGLSMAGWCRSQSIPFSTFDYWRQQLAPISSTRKADSPQKNNPAPEWLSVAITGDPSGPTPSFKTVSDVLSLRVGKVTIDVVPGFNSALLLDVLCVLEARC